MVGTHVNIMPGIYRECVRPMRGGDGPDRMICYEAGSSDGEVIITASEDMHAHFGRHAGPIDTVEECKRNMEIRALTETVYARSSFLRQFTSAYIVYLIGNARYILCKWLILPRANYSKVSLYIGS